jgi:hypothetical protein
LWSVFPEPRLEFRVEDEREELKQRVRWMGDHVADQAEPVESWLRRCEVIEATKKEFQDDGPHKFWANDYALRPPEEREYLLASTPYYESTGGVGGRLRIGVAFHPWMTVLPEYRPEVTLNTPEIDALYPAAEYFRDVLLWEGGVMVYAPFPDTPRRTPSDDDQEAFARALSDQGDKPGNYTLHYVRNYVLSVRLGGIQRPKALRGFGFTRRGAERIKKNLKLGFSRI